MFPSHLSWSWELGRELLGEDRVTFFTFVHDKWQLQVSQLWVMLSLSCHVMLFSLERLSNLSCFTLDGYADTSVCSCEGSSIRFLHHKSGRDMFSGFHQRNACWPTSPGAVQSPRSSSVCYQRMGEVYTFSEMLPLQGLGTVCERIRTLISYQLSSDALTLGSSQRDEAYTLAFSYTWGGFC